MDMDTLMVINQKLGCRLKTSLLFNIFHLPFEYLPSVKTVTEFGEAVFIH